MLAKLTTTISILILISTQAYSDNILHEWRKLAIGGFQGGIIGINENKSVGFHGIYNTSLIHTNSFPTSLSRVHHRINTGIIGMGNYLLIDKDERVKISLIPCSGYYTSDNTLIHAGAGLLYDSVYGYGASSIIMITSQSITSNDRTFYSIFTKLDYVNRQNTFQIGIAISIGDLTIKSE